MAAMPNMIDETNSINLERLRLLSRHAIFTNQEKFILVLTIINSLPTGRQVYF
jgi:hypothetical protein